MATFITNKDILDIPKGTIIEIPDDEMSFCYKGKGWFLYIYKDSDLISQKYPDILFKPIPFKDLENKRYSMEELQAFDHIYNDKYHLKLGNGNEITTSYKALKEDGYMEVDNCQIKSGDLVYKICPSGNKVFGIASNCIIGDSENFLCNENKDEALYFNPVIDYNGIDGPVRAGRAYNLINKHSSFYVKATKDSVNSNLLWKALESLLDTFVKGMVYIDKEKMRLTRVLVDIKIAKVQL